MATKMLVTVLRLFGQLLYWAGLARPVIALSAKRPRVLLYHACEPVETSFTRGLGSNSPPERFAQQMVFLRRYYTPVDLRTCLGPGRPPRAVAITFDDGYRSVYEHAFPLLRSHSLPATVYVIAGAGPDSIVWVNAVNWMLNSESSAEVRAVVAARFGVDPNAIEGMDLLVERLGPAEAQALTHELAEACSVNLNELARTADLFLTDEQMEEMAQNGFTFGNHTSTHPNLSRASAAEAQAEVERAHRRISGLPSFVPSFAYPFGYRSSAAMHEAQRLGYTTIMEVGGVNAPLDLLGVARQPVADESPAELFAMLEVVEPIKAWIRKPPWSSRGEDGDTD